MLPRGGCSPRRRKSTLSRNRLVLHASAAVLVVAALVLFGACGSGESNEAPTRSQSPTTALSRTPTPTPTFPQTDVEHVVQEGETVYGIAQMYGVTVEAIAAANHLVDPAAISIGQVLIIPDPAFTPAPATPTPTMTTADARLTGFLYPIAGACLPSSENLMPNAPREYRSGIHEGVDFYSGYNCTDIPVNTAVMATRAGTVIRAGAAFVEMTLEELNTILARTQAQGYTDAEALDKFRGRQVWVDHGNGLVTRYCHLAGIPDGITEGMQVRAGDPIGFVGDSGTPEAVTNPGVEIHLHWEIWVDGSYLGAGLPAGEVRAIYERLFSGQ